MEKLKAFLEEENQKVLSELSMIIPEFAIKDHDKRLINFVLDIVGEEIEKKRQKMVTPAESDEDYQKHGNRELTRGWNHIRTGYNEALSDIQSFLDTEINKIKEL